MTVGLTLLGLGLLWIAKQALGSLIGQQIKGSVPDYTAKEAVRAAGRLPAELTEEYEAVWLAELAALEGKPISALRYACGLRRAARRIIAAEVTEVRRVSGARMPEAAKMRKRGLRALRGSLPGAAFGICTVACTGLSIELSLMAPLPDTLQGLAIGSVPVVRVMLGLGLFASSFIAFTWALILPLLRDMAEGK